MLRRLQREQVIPGEPAQVWAFFATPHNLDALTPPEVSFEIRSALPERMYAGQLIEYRIGILPGMKMRWLTEITHVRDGSYFVDEQRIGPYRLWHHEHHFTPAADRRSVLMVDRVTYDPGWGLLGGLVDALWIQRRLGEIFDYRARRITQLFGSSDPTDRAV